MSKYQIESYHGGYLLRDTEEHTIQFFRTRADAEEFAGYLTRSEALEPCGESTPSDADSGL
jgi:hypothetical protein